MTQCETLLAALKEGREITPLVALQEFGCLRLAARIYDLRKTHVIEERMIQHGKKKWAAYKLA